MSLQSDKLHLSTSSFVGLLILFFFFLWCRAWYLITLINSIIRGACVLWAHWEKRPDFPGNPSDSLLTRCFSCTRYLSLFDPCESENPRGRIWKAQMLCLKYQSVNIINDLLLMPLHIQLNLCYLNLQKVFNSMLF